jgi:TIGR02453 family protein
MDTSFCGFSPDTLRFLCSLRDNNNKEWFESNGGLYEKYVLQPMKALVSDIGPFMLSIDPYFDIAPSVNRTISRIYRDIRFSKDKSPYRSNIWITFKQMSRDWKGDPVFFFEIFPDFYRYGMGFYSASKDTMDNLRRQIDEKPREFLKAVSFLNDNRDFSLEGDKYKRNLKDLPPELLDWYQRKNLYITCSREIDNTLFSNKLLGELMSGFEKLSPFYHYLWKIKD